MGGCKVEGVSINSFCLVSYLPEPLAGFLDRLRSELVPQCHVKAHLTLLPPRPIFSSVDDAWRELRDKLQDFASFRVALGEVKVFDGSDVVYIAVGLGSSELSKMHRSLNTGELEFQEPFPYVPHITVAQDPANVAAALETARRRWSEYSGAHEFTVEKLTFVQNTLENQWVDLAGCALDHSNISI